MSGHVRKLSLSQILFKSQATKSTTDSPSPSRLPEHDRINRIWRKKGLKLGDDSISPVKKTKTLGDMRPEVLQLYYLSGITKI